MYIGLYLYIRKGNIIMSKLSLCVLFGGQSPEHEISRKSVTSILNNLNKDNYDITTVGITKDGRWLLYEGDYSLIEDGSWEKECTKKAFISPDSSDKGIIVFEDGGARTIHIDVIFPVLHGENGEDGTIQGLFELAGIKYVGMGVLSSAVAMDKTFTKIIMDSAGIAQANWVTVKAYDNLDEKYNEIEAKLGYPCFVKPACTGSSVGVGKAKNRDELKSAVANALEYGRKVLVEENIEGHEVECSVLGNENPKAAEVGEIMPTVEFYDFDAKYVDDSTKLAIPATVDESIREEIRSLAVRAFKAVDGTGLTRADFFVRYSDNKIILNEINTMPGFTNISMYPKLWMAKGMEYSQLLDELIPLAI